MKKMLAWGAVIAGAVALTGCEKPNPGATVWSGTNSEHATALCWSFDAATPIDEAQCAASLSEEAAAGMQFPEVAVAEGNTMGISVDPVVADNGWTPVIGGKPLTGEPITSPYWRFTFPQQPPEEGFELQILANGESPEQLRGVWAFKIVPPKGVE